MCARAPVCDGVRGRDGKTFNCEQKTFRRKPTLFLRFTFITPLETPRIRSGYVLIFTIVRLCGFYAHGDRRRSAPGVFGLVNKGFAD